jgi:cell division protein FtsL
MLTGFKMYIVMITMLILTQIVMAAENFINFHHEMRNYDQKEQQREPNQIEEKAVEKIELKNPELEIKIDEKKDEDPK